MPGSCGVCASLSASVGSVAETSGSIGGCAVAQGRRCDQHQAFGKGAALPLKIARRSARP